MTKLDLKNMDFCPPRKWLAIPKNGGKQFEFGLEDVIGGRVPVENDRAIRRSDYIRIAPEYRDTIKKVSLSECYLCGFTGYYDSKGEEVYGGDLLRTSTKLIHGETQYFLVQWSESECMWLAQKLSTGNYVDIGRLNAVFYYIHRIGHIHIKPWPEEVAELLKTLSGEVVERRK